MSQVFQSAPRAPLMTKSCSVAKENVQSSGSSSTCRGRWPQSSTMARTRSQRSTIWRATVQAQGASRVSQ